MFDGQPEAIKGIVNGKVKAGDVVVIGTKVEGDGECRNVSSTSLIIGMGLGEIKLRNH